MSAVVFARTRWKYDSYRDFWRLVELSGFRTCFLDEIDPGADVLYVASPINGEAERLRRDPGRPRRAIMVLWDLERPDGGHEGGDTAALLRARNDQSLLFFDEVWLSDRWLASMDPRTRYVLLGSHPGLANWNQSRGPFAWDLAHMSYVTGRRADILARLGRHFRIAPNSWGEERDAILRGSAALLNVHQTAAPVSEPLRIALAAAYRMPYLTEDTQDPHPLEPGRTCLMAPYQDIADRLESWISRDLSALGAALGDRLMVEDDFGRSIIRAAEAVRAET